MRPFRLLDLPSLQLKRVILFMNHCQRIKLAICSDKAEEIIRETDIRNIEIEAALVKFTYFRFARRFDVEDPDLDEKLYFHGISEHVKKGFRVEKIDKKVLSKRYMPGKEKEAHFNMVRTNIKFDTADLLKWMADMFPRAKLGWNIDLQKYSGDYLKRLYPVPHFNQAQWMHLGRGRLRSTHLTELFDIATNLEEFFIYATIPPSFYHEKALSFNRVRFEDARWIKVEHLMLMKGPFELTVTKTELDNEDLNRYLKYWKSTKDNVKGLMDLYLKKGVTFDRNALIDGLHGYSEEDRYTILCDNDSEREHPLGEVFFEEGSSQIIFETQKKQDDPLLRYDKLVLLRRATDLQKRVKELDSQMEQCQLGDPDEKIKYKELEDARKRLDNQLTVTKQQLHDIMRE